MTYLPNTPPPKPANSAARSWAHPASGSYQILQDVAATAETALYHGVFVGLRHGRAGLSQGAASVSARTCTKRAAPMPLSLIRSTLMWSPSRARETMTAALPV